jgi:hypothetical protein
MSEINFERENPECWLDRGKGARRATALAKTITGFSSRISEGVLKTKYSSLQCLVGAMDEAPEEGDRESVSTREKTLQQSKGRTGLGETLKTFNELWQVSRVLALNGNTNNRGHGELHDLDVVGTFPGADSTSLDKELIDTDKGANVTGWARVECFDTTTHHKVDTLDLFEVKIILLARNVVWSHDSDLGGSDGTGVDTSEGVESTFIGSWHHLGDVEHQVSVRVASFHRHASFIVFWTFVQGGGTVGTGGNWRWQVNANHLEEGVSGWEPLSDHGLQEWFAFHLLLIVVKLNLELGEELCGLWLVEVEDGLEQHEDWCEDELAVTTFVVITSRLVPLLCLCVVELITPEPGHELWDFNLEFVRVHFCELLEGVGPSMETGTETDGTVHRVNLDVSHRTIFFTVGCDDNVDVLDDTLESLVKIFLFKLEFEQGTVHLVQEQNWSDTLLNGLSKDSLGLDADTGDGINNNHGTISDTECSGDFGRKVNVSRRVNKVDQVSDTISLLFDVWKVLLWKFKEHRDGRALNGDTTVLFVLSALHESSVTNVLGGDDTGLSDEGIGEGGFTVIDVSDNGHVPDVLPLIHEVPDLVNCEGNPVWWWRGGGGGEGGGKEEISASK